MANVDGKAPTEGMLLLEVEGGDVHLENVDPVAILELGAAFFALLEVNADDLGISLDLRQVELLEKCAAIGVRPSTQDGARECAFLTALQLSGRADAPHGGKTFVDRARTARLRWGEEVGLRVALDGWSQDIDIETSYVEPPPPELLTMRAKPIRVGGKRPSVRFTSPLEDEAFTLRVSEDQARILGACLYQEVEISAQISRNAARTIDSGILQHIEKVADDDPRPAWRAWGDAVRRR